MTQISRFLFLLLLLCFSERITCAQSGAADSLLKLLKRLPADTTRVNVLIELSKKLNVSDFEKSIAYSKEAIQLSQQLKFLKGEALGYLNSAMVEIRRGNYPAGSENAYNALRIGEHINDSLLIALAYVQLGNLHRYRNENDEALNFYFKALLLAEKLSDQHFAGRVMYNIGIIYGERKQQDSSILYYKRSLELRKAIKDIRGMAYCTHALGVAYFYSKEYSRCLDYQQEALAYAIEAGDLDLQFSIYSLMTQLHLDTGKPEKAVVYGEKSLGIAKELKATFLLAENCATLAMVYASLKDFEKAYTYKSLEKIYQDSVTNEKNIKATEKLRYDYELERKEAQILRKQAVIEHQRGVGVMIAIGLICFAVMSFLLYLNYKAKQRENVRLKELNQVKDKLFSIMSHDLLAPLHSLKGVIDLMKAGALTNEEMDMVTAELSNKLGITTQMLENLLCWTKSQMEGMNIKPVNFNLKNSIAENKALLQGHAEKKEITIIDEVSEDCWVYADKNMINIVLRNLISNAVKFTNPGGSITISSTLEGSFLRVSIKDTGIGIQDTRSLFSGSLESTMGTASEKGTGLGLILCHDFVLKNGGRIGVESTPGAGSTFYFTIQYKVIRPLHTEPYL